MLLPIRYKKSNYHNNRRGEKTMTTEPKGFDFGGAQLVEDSQTALEALGGIPTVELPESVLDGTDELTAALDTTGGEVCSETEISLSYTTRRTTEQ